MASANRVLAIQHERVEGPGRIARALNDAGIQLRVLRVDQGEPVPIKIDGYSGLIVLGGPMGVYEQEVYPHLDDELALIESTLSKNVPLLGICLGSQLIASALGARVYPSGGQEIGWGAVSLKPAAKQDRLLQNAPQSFQALHWHGDIFDLPKDAVSLASSERTEHQAFSYGAQTWGFLFHCEAEAKQIQAMTDRFAEDLVRASIPPTGILSVTETNSVQIEPIADTIFSKWAECVSAGVSR